MISEILSIKILAHKILDFIYPTATMLDKDYETQTGNSLFKLPAETLNAASKETKYGNIYHPKQSLTST